MTQAGGSFGLLELTIASERPTIECSAATLGAMLSRTGGGGAT